jgi:hypothetical protein
VRRVFDPEAIKAQIANLITERERIDQVINAFQAALRTMEGIEPSQTELTIGLNASGVTLSDAVRAACVRLVDAITRQRVIAAIEREHPMLRPKPASVAAALINLAKGSAPLLKLAIAGTGARPAYYSTDADITLRLSADEIAILTAEAIVKGEGGWQSLWASLQKAFVKATGEIVLTPAMRSRLYLYYHKYGEGGWQTKALRVFRRQLPHLFAP